jgi:hypothetical protein
VLAFFPSFLTTTQALHGLAQQKNKIWDPHKLCLKYHNTIFQTKTIQNESLYNALRRCSSQTMTMYLLRLTKLKLCTWSKCDSCVKLPSEVCGCQIQKGWHGFHRDRPRKFWIQIRWATLKNKDKQKQSDSRTLNTLKPYLNMNPVPWQ